MKMKIEFRKKIKRDGNIYSTSSLVPFWVVEQTQKANMVQTLLFPYWPGFWRTIIILLFQTVIVQQSHPRPANYMWLSCVVFWCCNPLFGTIAFFLSCKLSLKVSLYSPSKCVASHSVYYRYFDLIKRCNISNSFQIFIPLRLNFILVRIWNVYVLLCFLLD